MDFSTEYNQILNEIPKNPQAGLLGELKARHGGSFSETDLIVYGAGVVLNWLYDDLKAQGIRVTALCDSVKTGAHALTGLPILSPEQLKSQYPKARVLIATLKYFQEIRAFLQTLGFSGEQIYPFLIPHRCPPEEFEAVHADAYRWAYGQFEDAPSRKLVMDRIRMHLLNQAILPNSDSSLYFEKNVVSLREGEVFADCGAYTGDTAEEFIEQMKRCKRAYRHIWAFEPDAENYRAALENLKAFPDVSVIPKGVWKESGELAFFTNGNEDASYTAAQGGTASEIVPVVSLDDFFSSQDSLPFFIKMDIEGAEKEALLGAEKVIRQAKPLLAVACYHKTSDIYELPRTILKLRDDYRFVLRHYVYGYSETVLYAF